MRTRGGSREWLRRAVRLGLLTGAAAAAVGTAVHLSSLESPDPVTAAPATSATGLASPPSSQPSSQPSTPPQPAVAPPTGARAGLEATLSRPARASGTSAAGAPAPVDESLPHTHVVDPRTGGLISVAGAQGVVPDVKDLGPIHSDPLPVGVSLSDSTDTDSLLDRAGAVQLARAGDPLAAAATAPVGTPGVSSLSQHVVPSCSGTGTDGNRVQAMYVHEADRASRYSSVLPVLRSEVASVDDVFAVSAQQTGGQRRVRWVHDAQCRPVIAEVTVPKGALGSDFWGTVDALKKLGYKSPSRKYLMFTDANKLCGIGSMYDDPRVTGNANDGAYASYARVDVNCWSTTTSVAAHELTHTLGGVLGSAPHATKYGHCYDDSDLMCYDDGSGIPMKRVCANAQEQLLDCHHDDYFNTSPPAGSFLSKNWNTASSSFLDRVVTPGGAPTVGLKASAGSAETGDAVAFTATSPRTVTWSWTASANASACSLTPGAPGRATLRCPSSVTGRVTVTATAREAGNDVPGSGSAVVTLARAVAPGATVTAPATLVPGTTVPVSVATTGKAAFVYAWQAGPCTVAAPTQAATTVTCPSEDPPEAVEVSVLARQADGQAVRASATVRLGGSATGFTTAPLTGSTPIGTAWSTPEIAAGVLTARLRTSDGTAVAGRPVTLQARWYGTDAWVELRTLATDATGLARVGTTYPWAGSLRLSLTGAGNLSGSASPSVFVRTATTVSSSHPSTHRVAATVRTASGTPLAGVPIRLERRAVGSSAWTAAATVRTDARGSVAQTVQPAKDSRYRWVYQGDAQRLASQSGDVLIRH